MPDPTGFEFAEIVGAVVGAVAAGGVGAWQFLKRRPSAANRADEDTPRHLQAVPPPGGTGHTGLTDVQTHERDRMALELTQRIYELAVEEQVSRVDERRRDEKLDRIAELLDQLYVRGQRAERSGTDRTRQIEDQLARMERVLHDMRRRLPSSPPREEE